MIENKEKVLQRALNERKKNVSQRRTIAKIPPYSDNRTSNISDIRYPKKKQKRVCGFFPPRLKDEEGDKVVNLKRIDLLFSHPEDAVMILWKPGEYGKIYFMFMPQLYPHYKEFHLSGAW